jgi:hypothetical protein
VCHATRWGTKQAGPEVTLQICSRELLGSNLGRDIGRKASAILTQVVESTPRKSWFHFQISFKRWSKMSRGGITYMHNFLTGQMRTPPPPQVFSLQHLQYHISIHVWVRYLGDHLTVPLGVTSPDRYCSVLRWVPARTAAIVDGKLRLIHDATRNVMWYISWIFITEHADGIQVIPDIATLFCVQWLFRIIMTYFEKKKKSGRKLLFATLLHKKLFENWNFLYLCSHKKTEFSIFSEVYIFFMQIKNNFLQYKYSGKPLRIISNNPWG